MTEHPTESTPGGQPPTGHPPTEPPPPPGSGPTPPGSAGSDRTPPGSGTYPGSVPPGTGTYGSSVPPGGGAYSGTTPPPGSGTDRFFASLRGVDVRRTDDGWIGGVCAGLAHRLGLDPVVIRAGAVVLGIFFGLGLGLYLLAWLLVPDTRERTMLERGMRGGEAGPIVLLVVTAVVLLGSLPWWGLMTFDEPGSAIVSILVIGALGWALWTAWQRRAAPGEVGRTGTVAMAAMAGSAAGAAGTGGAYAATATPPPPPGAAAGTRPADPAASGHPSVPSAPGTYPPAAYPGQGYPPGSTPPPGAPPQAWGPPPPPQPPKPRRLRRLSPGPVGALIVSGLLLMVVGGLIWAGDGLGIPGNTVAVALAAGLAMLGAVLVALGFLGRRAGFVAFLAWVTLVATAVTAPLPTDISWPDGDRDVVWNPTTVTELRDFDLGAGTAELTLQNLDPAGLNGQTVEVDLGAGELRIVVPQGLDVTVNSEVGAGDITVERDGSGSSTEGGLGVSEQTVIGDRPSQLEIDANVGLGQITIVQE